MAFRPQPAVTASNAKSPLGRGLADRGKPAVKSKKRAKPAEGKKHHRGMLDVPKAVETRMAEGRAERESVPLEAHGEWAAPDGVRTRSGSWRSRTRRACPSSCRSATGA